MKQKEGTCLGRTASHKLLLVWSFSFLPFFLFLHQEAAEAAARQAEMEARLAAEAELREREERRRREEKLVCGADPRVHVFVSFFSF